LKFTKGKYVTILTDNGGVEGTVVGTDEEAVKLKEGIMYIGGNRKSFKLAHVLLKKIIAWTERDV
jgi:hypothetical protein